jgi:DNA-binding CsgD family transcriptional regulator
VRDNGKIDLIGRLYDAATDAGKWGAVLDDLMTLFEATGCHLTHYDYHENRMAFSVHKGCDHMSDALWKRYEELLPEDPRLPVYEKYPGMPQACRMTIDEAVLHESRFYREILVPAEVEYTLGVKLDGDGQSTITGLAILRNSSCMPFQRADCDRLGEIIPHLVRAMAMHKRFTLLDFGHRAALEALDHIATGIILLELDGTVRFANQLAQDIAADADGVRLAAGSVTFTSHKMQSAVIAAVGEAIASARDGRILPGQAFSIPRPSGAAPYALLVSTLWGNHLRFDLGLLDDPVAVLFLSDPQRRQEAPAELLQRLFGLTPAESRVLENLVAGHSLKTTAGILEVSQNTARHHLKAIFDKTNTSRQVDVVKLVMSTPLWIEYSRPSGDAGQRHLSATE